MKHYRFRRISDPHTHYDSNGLAVKCYHHCKSLLTDWKFFIGVTISFPIEHFIWEKIWPLTIVTKWLGL